MKQDTITYLGVKFPIAKHYANDDEFKSDPDNYSPDQIVTIQRLLAGIDPPRSLPSRNDVTSYAATLKVPGYGSYSFGTNTSIGRFEFHAAEIPKTNDSRWLVYLSPTGSAAYKLFDTFVDSCHITHLRVLDSKIRYLHFKNVVREKQLD